MGVSGAGAGCGFLGPGATETPEVVLQKSGVRAAIVAFPCEAQEAKMPMQRILNTSIPAVTIKRFFLIRSNYLPKGKSDAKVMIFFVSLISERAK